MEVFLYNSPVYLTSGQTNFDISNKSKIIEKFHLPKITGNDFLNSVHDL